MGTIFVTRGRKRETRVYHLSKSVMNSIPLRGTRIWSLSLGRSNRMGRYVGFRFGVVFRCHLPRQNRVGLYFPAPDGMGVKAPLGTSNTCVLDKFSFATALGRFTPFVKPRIGCKKARSNAYESSTFTSPGSCLGTRAKKEAPMGTSWTPGDGRSTSGRNADAGRC